jgi:hypothetical protein
MAHTISEWLLPLLSGANFSAEPGSSKNSRLEKRRAESASFDSHKSLAHDLSTEEEIIIQMGKECPTIFIA